MTLHRYLSDSSGIIVALGHLDSIELLHDNTRPQLCGTPDHSSSTFDTYQTSGITASIGAARIDLSGFTELRIRFWIVVDTSTGIVTVSISLSSTEQ